MEKLMQLEHTGNETEKEKVLLVLKASVEKAIKDGDYTPAELNYLDERVELFKNLDEGSEVYKTIVINAKQALIKMKIGEFGFYQLELIKKFLKLENIFRSRLKSIKVREKFPTQRMETNKPGVPTFLSPDDVKHIKEGLTGSRFKQALKKDKEALESHDIEDEEEDEKLTGLFD